MDLKTMVIVMIVVILVLMVAMIMKYRSISAIITKDGKKLIFPQDRPEGYFQKGDQVIICNTAMSRIPRDPARRFFPEADKKIISGIVTCPSLHDGEYIRIKAEGRINTFTLSCPLIMHDWEYDILRESFFTRKLWSRSSVRIANWFNPQQFERAVRRAY